MKADAAVLPGGRTLLLARCADFIELTKPRIALMVLLTVAVGGLVSVRGQADVLVLFCAIVGTALVAAGASAWNQWWERDSDRRMARTRNRPLPAGRLTSQEVFAFGLLLLLSGSALLLATVNGLTALLAILSFVLYVFVYTPLKARTVLNTVVGAIPGALPPVIGFAALRGTVNLEALALFMIVFTWQFPHFFAIAWLYHEDYRHAGLRMLPTTALGRRLTGLHVVSCCLVLLPVSLWPVQLQMAGPVYFWGALVLGLQFLAYGIAFAIQPHAARARVVLVASLLYLPAVLALLTLDVVRFGQ